MASVAVSAARRRARRWFWSLLVIAVLGMGVVYRSIDAPSSPAVGTAFLLGSVVVLAALVQATRIWAALEGPVRVPRWFRRHRSATTAGGPSRDDPAGPRRER
ncbi:hypothetical protein V5H98_07660 [Georgenia sp. M64]|uniref:hypothetical protein n=1 Tax=Georgenia sp. M64 TaxID=3120520 RepID=UPI0030E2C953